MKFSGFFYALALISLPAFATDELHLGSHFGLGFGGGAPIPVGKSTFNNTTKTGWMGEGHLDFYFTDALGIEAQYQHLSYQVGQPLNNVYTLGLNYRWFSTARFTPLLGLAGGWSTSSAKLGLDGDYSNFIANGRIGLDYAACDSLVLELSGKFSWLFSRTASALDQQSIIPQFNLTYFFGEGHAETAPVIAPPPAPAVVPVDGDDDGDGVPNSVDKCPNTPPGTKVNSFGCPVNEAINEKIDIEFLSGKSTIPEEYYVEVDKIVDLMKKHTDVNAEIQGYTDNVGKKAKNQKLSEKRANAVRAYLIKEGIDEARVTAKGYGEENPEADNTTPEGRKKNRRVVASLKSI